MANYVCSIPLHNELIMDGAGAFGGRPIVVQSIIN